MPSINRRRLLGGVAGLAAVGGGTIIARQYRTREHVQFRPLAVENESAETATVRVTVVDESGAAADTVHQPVLSPAGADGARTVLRDRSVSYPAPYAVTAERTDADGDESLSLSHAAIIERLPTVGWRTEHVAVTVRVEPDGSLSAQIDRTAASG